MNRRKFLRHAALGFAATALVGGTTAIADQGTQAVHRSLLPRDLRRKAGITQEQMAPIVGMNLTDYQDWESRPQRLHGATGSLFKILDKEPGSFKRILLADS